PIGDPGPWGSRDIPLLDVWAWPHLLDEPDAPIVHNPRTCFVTSGRGRSTTAGKYDARSRWAPAETPATDRRRQRRRAPPSRGSHRGGTSAPRRAPRDRR